MKRFLRFLPFLLLAVAGSATLCSCSDDDKDEFVDTDTLPAQAKTFIAQYYPSAKVVLAQKDKDEYEVTLSEGTRIDFDKAGEWTDVDAPAGKTVATGFYPEAIDTYVNTNFAGSGINEISKEQKGSDVELTNGIDLVFSYDGTFISFD